jgi:transposase-like protein
MVYEAVVCPHCHQPEAVYRHGRTADGCQRYRCTACRRRFQLHYRHTACQAGTADKIEQLALNGSGIRDQGLRIKREAIHPGAIFTF